MDRSGADDELLGADAVAAYLGVRALTVYRWCRDGRLPALKVGKSWRVRRGALDEFLRQSERGQTLVSRLNTFYAVPDHVIAVAVDPVALHRLDAAFFQIGDARGGLLIKNYAGETASVDELRAGLMRRGLDVAALEAAGRFRFVAEVDPGAGRAEALRRLLAGPDAAGRPVWVDFDWVKGVDLDVVLRQQQAIAGLIDAARLVVQTAVLAEVVEAWSPGDQRRAERAHRGLIWIADNSLTLSRVTPLPSA